MHRLQLRFHKTIVFVTHDMDEAVKLADRICILQNGHVVQCDKPENIDVYKRQVRRSVLRGLGALGGDGPLGCLLYTSRCV